MALVVGASDEILHVLEESFDARLTVRGDRIVIEGNAVEVQQLTALFADLFKTVEEGQGPRYRLRCAVPSSCSHQAEFAPAALRDDVLLTYRGRAIRPKTAGQKRYVDAIRDNTVTFGIGPAGTGKTYLAMAMAVAALKRKEVGRIVLYAAHRGGRREPRFSAGHPLREGGSLHPAALRCAVRHDRSASARMPAHRERHHRDRSSRLHARAHLKRQPSLSWTRPRTPRPSR